MATVADLVSVEALRELARPSDIAAGRKLQEQGAVELLALEPHKVLARVGGTIESPTRRKVELSSNGQRLSSSCTCSRSGRFCKHCVATAIELWERAAQQQF